MHNLIRVTVLAAMLVGTVAPLSAATPSEFYTGLLRRGMASYDASRYSDASRQLRIAAFGLVEAIDQYQVAQVYLALTLEKLGETDRAREAAHRVAVAERIERRYGSLALPAALRSAFDALSARVLSSTDAALLRSSSTTPPPPAAQTATKPVTPPRTTTTTTTTNPVAPPPVTTQPVAKPQTTQTTAAPIVTPPPVDPEKPKPQPQPVKPPQTVTATPKPAPPKPAATTTFAPAPTPVVSTPAAPPPPRTLSAGEVASRLTIAERALNGGNLIDARRVYRDLLSTAGLDHDTLMRIAEGLYRSRDFAAALQAFNRVGTLRRGEEPYRYYIAVALYETGDHARAKKELAAALPYIEITPDVARYRSKIESPL